MLICKIRSSGRSTTVSLKKMRREYVAIGAFQIAKEDTETNLADHFTKVLPRPRRELLLNKFTYWIKGRDEISNRCIADWYIGWGDRINSATLGYIRVLISTVKVNRVEEGISNPEYILLWFWRNQKSRIRIGSSYLWHIPMMAPMYPSNMEAIPYEHVQVTGKYRLWLWLERVRGQYAGHTVRSWRQYRTSMDKSQVSTACDRD